MITQMGIDWLTAVYPYGELIDGAIDWLYADMRMSRVRNRTVYPQRGYTAVVPYTVGSVSYNPRRQEMGACLIWTGSDLDAIRALGYNSDHACARVTAIARASRIDIACDTDAPMNIRDIYDTIIARPDATTGRAMMYIASSDAGQGVYIGASSSNRRIRIYDKAAELRIPDIRNRIELVLRGGHAHAAPTAIAEHGIAPVWRSHVKQMLRLSGTQWYDDVMSGPVATLDALGRKSTDTIAWLRETVLPVLRRALKSGDPRADELRAAYRAALDS